MSDCTDIVSGYRVMNTMLHNTAVVGGEVLSPESMMSSVQYVCQRLFNLSYVTVRKHLPHRLSREPLKSLGK